MYQKIETIIHGLYSGSQQYGWLNFVTAGIMIIASLILILQNKTVIRKRIGWGLMIIAGLSICFTLFQQL
ncbi:hypothetical protein IGI37_001348 [Enterococcus sp. AZ194]|uniref:hypothetical protein n=1 Tax=Enterococcus sp. AZ194 TaxID=2774629 RepID=UPI003F27C68B